MSIFIKGDDGQPSVSVTLVVVAFVATLFAYLLSILEKVGPVSFRQFDVAACSAFLIPTMTLYFGRRATDVVTKKAETEAATSVKIALINAPPDPSVIP